MSTNTVNAPWIRLHVLNVAKSLSWVHLQTSTNTDTYSKGGVTITAEWGSTQVGAITSTAGASIPAGESSKLQKLCTLLGARMTNSQLFTTVPAGHPAKLVNLPTLKLQASKSFKVIAAKPAPAKPAPAKGAKPAKPAPAKGSRAAGQHTRDQQNMAEL
jgi:hypothetical protein